MLLIDIKKLIFSCLFNQNKNNGVVSLFFKVLSWCFSVIFWRNIKFCVEYYKTNHIDLENVRPNTWTMLVFSLLPFWIKERLPALNRSWMKRDKIGRSCWMNFSNGLGQTIFENLLIKIFWKIKKEKTFIKFTISFSIEFYFLTFSWNYLFVVLKLNS